MPIIENTHKSESIRQERTVNDMGASLFDAQTQLIMQDITINDMAANLFEAQTKQLASDMTIEELRKEIEALKGGTKA